MPLSPPHKTEKSMPLSDNRDTHIEALYVFIGENLSEERFPLTEAVPSVSYADTSPHCGESTPNPFPKTFNRILPHNRAHLKDLKKSCFTGVRPIMGQN